MFKKLRFHVIGNTEGGDAGRFEDDGVAADEGGGGPPPF